MQLPVLVDIPGCYPPNFAQKLSDRPRLVVVNTTGVLLKAKELGIIAAVAPQIDQLRQGGIRLGDDVVAEVLRLAGES